MKLKREELSNHLKKELSPAYWISGDETQLIEQSRQQIRNSAKQQGFVERCTFHQLDPQFDWSQFFGEINTESLFAEKQLIELKLWNFKVPKEAQEQLTDYIEKPSPNKKLVVISERLTPAQRNLKWVKNFDKHGVSIQIWPLSKMQQQYWLQDQLSNAGFSMDRQTLAWFNDQTEGHLLAACNTIEKLKLLCKPGKINHETLSNILVGDTNFDVFALSDAILSGDRKKCLKVLTSLQQQGTEPSLTLWAITKDIRLLYLLSIKRTKGENLESIMTKEKIWKSKQPMILRSLGRLTTEKLQNILSQTNKVDRLLKGVQPGSAWQSLTQIVISLSR